MFGTAKSATVRQGKAVGGDEAEDTANKALQHDALSKLNTQSGADNTADDVLGQTEDLIKNPPAVPENTPERDAKNKAVEKKRAEHEALLAAQKEKELNPGMTARTD